MLDPPANFNKLRRQQHKTHDERVEMPALLLRPKADDDDGLFELRDAVIAGGNTEREVRWMGVSLQLQKVMA